jgi:transcriptional regulator with GAF, ATPase, and Fis domain
MLNLSHESSIISGRKPVQTEELSSSRRQASAGVPAPLLLGSSAQMEHLREDVLAAARSDAKVLIVGETGVGKEIVARLIHEAGRRRARSFVTINCAGLPDSLLESELFGHVRGSFTGAYRDKPGLAAMAHNGTLFLDELGEMSLRMQALLLRFLETGEIQRVGAERIEGRLDVRVIAATNRNLTERIESREFREDLYYRLNVLRLAIPPLRERGEDIAILLRHYLTECARQHGVEEPRLSPAAHDILMRYHWPGNVRTSSNGSSSGIGRRATSAPTNCRARFSDRSHKSRRALSAMPRRSSHPPSSSGIGWWSRARASGLSSIRRSSIAS